MPALGDVSVGTELPPGQFPITRSHLVRYAGASGDFNVIHHSERIARAVGLPDVIAHGMLTMALATRVVTAWAGDPSAVVAVKVRFSRPVVVPDTDEGVQLTVTGVVEELLDGGLVAVALTARCGDDKVLSGARATVRLGA